MGFFFRQKNNRTYYIVWAVTLALLSGCSKETEVSLPDDHSIRIFHTISTGEADTRLFNSAFERNDQIGVYLIPYQSDNITPGSFPQDAYESNIEYIYNGANWNQVTGEPITWPGKRKTDIYGYYPYNSSLSDLTPEEYRFDVQTDQSTTAGYMQSDFLWAKSEGLSPVKNVLLTFHHKMSLVSINVLSQMTRAVADMEVSLVDINPSASIAMTTGNVTLISSGQDAEIRMLKLAQTETGYDNSYQAIVPPQTIAKDSRLIRVKLNGINYYFQPPNDIQLESGKHTVFNIAITRQGLSVYYTIVSKWQNGGVYTDSTEKEAPKVVDLASVDWNKSLVHNVHHKGVPVARISKEYLFKSGVVDVQAIVVYPMGTEGTPDLTKGFVAQVMNRNRNTASGVYEPNSNNVHGGNVSFNGASNMLTGYTAGTSARIGKVEVTTDNSIIQASNNAIALLTTQPVVVTDVDDNDYPVVKIGTQYWTTQNYHAEHYRNGDPLTYYYFSDNRSLKTILGALYPWATIMDKRGIAPEGWQPPGEPDWQSLYNYLTPNAGMKLKAYTMWSSLLAGDNITGFSALPGGRRTNTGTYNEIGEYGQWWSTTPYGTTAAYRLYLSSGSYAMTLATLSTSYTQSLRLISKTLL